MFEILNIASTFILKSIKESQLFILFLSFECRNGYELSGNKTSICIYNKNHSAAKWSKRAPTCKRKLNS